MKRLLYLSLIISTVISVNAKGLELLSGSTNFFKEKEGEMHVVLIMDNALIKGQSIKCEDYYRQKGGKDLSEWEEGKKYASNTFCKHFNDIKTSAIKLKASEKESDNTRYTLVADIKEIELGTNTGIVLGTSMKSGGMRFYGTITIKDNKTKGQMCVLEMKKVKSIATKALQGKIMLTCSTLAEDLIDEIR